MVAPATHLFLPLPPLPSPHLFYPALPFWEDVWRRGEWGARARLCHCSSHTQDSKTEAKGAANVKERRACAYSPLLLSSLALLLLLAWGGSASCYYTICCTEFNTMCTGRSLWTAQALNFLAFVSLIIIVWMLLKCCFSSPNNPFRPLSLPPEL